MILEFLRHLIAIFLRVSEGGKSFPPPLSAEEERICFERMRHGDMKAREKLIEHNLRLVAHIVKKYYTASKNQEDLISIGTIGLIKAIDSFNPKQGTKFATYASKCLQNEILMHFRSQRKTSAEVSINETIDMDKDGNPLTYTDVVSCDDTIVDDINLKINRGKLVYAVNNLLNEREREIIILRYGLGGDEPETQRVISKRLNISRSYVSRIEKGAIEKMNRYMKECGVEN